MRKSDRRRLLAVFALFLTSCTFARQPASQNTPPTPSATITAFIPASTPTPAPAVTNPHLLAALGFVPADATQVNFTDWTIIKQIAGQPNLTSRDDRETKLKFLFPNEHWIALSLAAYALSFQALDNWSMDGMDLEWEATVSLPGEGAFSSAMVLKFRDDLDLAAVERHFVEYGFQRDDVEGVSLYSHAPDPKAPWAKLMTPDLLNTAVLPQEHVLIISRHNQLVRDVIEARGGKTSVLRDDPAVVSSTASLGATWGVQIVPGSTVCAQLQSTKILDKLKQQNAKAFREMPADLKAAYTAVHPYDLFVWSLRTADQPAGTLKLHYSQSETAQTDVEPRRMLATKARSIKNSKPYSESAFMLTKIDVAGNDMVLEMASLPARPRWLLDLRSYTDFEFAVCP